MLEKVKKFIDENNLIESGDNIVVGVSGGADSVCLLLMLKDIAVERSFEIIAVHINHGIRGEEASEDEQFVEKLSRECGIECITIGFDIPAISKERNISVEEAGREVRYEAFRKVALEYGANKIAVAHNMNDSVETVLLSLFRGTGIKGLTGIKSSRDEIIRPLLCLKRSEIEGYLEQRGVVYRNDSTNFQDIYARNKIRNSIIPEIKKDINPGVEDNILVMSKQLEEIETFLDKLTMENYKGPNMLLSDIEKLDVVIRRRLIRRAMEEKAGKLKDITATHINDTLGLMEKSVGKTVHLPYGLKAIRTYNSISIIERGTLEPSENILLELKIPGKYLLGNGQGLLTVTLHEREEIQEIEEKIYTKFLDYDRIKDTLYLRNRMEGDYLIINSRGNTKKIKSYFIDEKIPLKERDSILLVAQGNHVLWIIGHRISEEFKVTDRTKKIIKFEFSRGKDER